MSHDPAQASRRLLLLRHAKSSWDDPELSDHDRPLNRRGRDAAARIGAYLARSGQTPSRVLCSSARRTRETLERLAPHLGAEPDVEVLEELYLASPDTLRACIEAAPDSAQDLLVIAHNPGTAQLAAALSERGDPQLRRQVRSKFPTGALAVFRSASASWREFWGAPGRGSGCELVDFAVPRDLPKA